MTNVQQEIKRIALGAKIVRADGTVEDLGTVAEYQSNPRKKSSLLSAISVVNQDLYTKYLRSLNG